MTDHAPADVTRPPPPGPADTPRAGGTGGAGPGQGVYLYAVTPARETYAQHDGVAGGELRGVGGGAVRPVARGGLVAHVSDVPLDEFGEEPLRRHLEDLDWVEGVARAHHAVVEALAGAGPTAPVRLVTVYTGEEQVRDLLDRRHDDFAEILAHVAGRREWGVKAYLRRETAQPATTPPDRSAASPARTSAEPEGGGPGAAYLRRRKESLRGREDLWRAAAERAEELHAALGRLAVASRRHRPQDPRLSGRSESMLLNGAYLVDPAHEEEFAAVVAAHRDRFLDVEITGPWAPYSFTMIDLGTDRDGGVR
ncbi:GvpL/GvpF family gas vesicle protein [Microbispora amethystogenes]|uniref:Gas vesicle protein n=1 Tax=Microbispora amethystogenes TaxID=1427754 RepID=A0ABQ4FNJ3_9ACTN|nr:GvpL/GvpF family gas vesicle protein [Microbispora amethystogenes]GIH36367.1 gas vesicle protein [Microbispora amethystogenes]